jgi:hypothetical protein
VAAAWTFLTSGGSPRTSHCRHCVIAGTCDPVRRTAGPLTSTGSHTKQVGNATSFIAALPVAIGRMRNFVSGYAGPVEQSDPLLERGCQMLRIGQKRLPRPPQWLLSSGRCALPSYGRRRIEDSRGRNIGRHDRLAARCHRHHPAGSHPRGLLERRMGDPTFTPTRSPLARPAGENGEPRSLVKTQDDLAPVHAVVGAALAAHRRAGDVSRACPS